MADYRTPTALIAALVAALTPEQRKNIALHLKAGGDVYVQLCFS